MNRALIGRLCFFIHLASACVYSLNTTENFYTEHAYLSREQVFSSSVRGGVELHVLDWGTPYFRLGSEINSLADKWSDTDTLSYGYFAPGFKVGEGPFLLLTEIRLRQYYKSASVPRENTDVRSTLVYFNFFKSDNSLFLEPYSETVFTSADANNIIHTSYARAGLRHLWQPSFATDIYFEPFLTLDKNRHYYNNRVEAKMGARMLYQVSSLSFSLLTTLGYQVPLNRGDAEVNPFTSNPWSVKSLLVMGGEF